MHEPVGHRWCRLLGFPLVSSVATYLLAVRTPIDRRNDQGPRATSPVANNNAIKLHSRRTAPGLRSRREMHPRFQVRSRAPRELRVQSPGTPHGVLRAAEGMVTRLFGFGPSGEVLSENSQAPKLTYPKSTTQGYSANTKQKQSLRSHQSAAKRRDETTL